MNKKLLLSLGSIAAIAAPVAAVVACGSDDNGKTDDKKTVDGITVNDINTKLDEILSSLGINKATTLASAIPNPGDENTIKGVKADFTGWTPNNSKGEISWTVTLTKGEATRTLSGKLTGFETEASFTNEQNEGTQVVKLTTAAAAMSGANAKAAMSLATKGLFDFLKTNGNVLNKLSFEVTLPDGTAKKGEVDLTSAGHYKTSAGTEWTRNDLKTYLDGKGLDLTDQGLKIKDGATLDAGALNFVVRQLMATAFEEFRFYQVTKAAYLAIAKELIANNEHDQKTDDYINQHYDGTNKVNSTKVVAIDKNQFKQLIIE